MNLRVSQNTRNSLTSWGPVSFSWRALLHGVKYYCLIFYTHIFLYKLLVPCRFPTNIARPRHNFPINLACLTRRSVLRFWLFGFTNYKQTNNCYTNNFLSPKKASVHLKPYYTTFSIQMLYWDICGGHNSSDKDISSRSSAFLCQIISLMPHIHMFFIYQRWYLHFCVKYCYQFMFR